MSPGKIVLGVIVHHDSFLKLALLLHQKKDLIANLKSM
jgi:hypothetical protein